VIAFVSVYAALLGALAIAVMAVDIASLFATYRKLDDRGPVFGPAVTVASWVAFAIFAALLLDAIARIALKSS
jgi:hypothetical protein